MYTDSMDLMKLDDGLSTLLRSGLLKDDELVSVIVRADQPKLDAVIELLGRSHGRVQRVLRPIGAVVALLPIGQIEGLTHAPLISELELDQVSYIA